MAGEDEEKTEEPTAKRLRDAQKEGQVANSREINNWGVLFGLTMIILFVIPIIFRDLLSILGHFITNFEDIDMSNGAAIGATLTWLMQKIGVVLSLPIGIIMVIALASAIGQTGLIFTGKPIQPKLEKLNPIKGLKRIFSLRQLIEFVKGLFKLFLIAAIGVVVLSPELQRLDIIPSMSIAQLLEEILWLIIKFLVIVLILMMIIAFADYSYQKYDHIKKLRMTRHEIKEEFKQTEGNPEIKKKIFQIRRARHAENLRQSMAKATVLITNPTHYAVALYYEEQLEAPILLAKGIDMIALNMRKMADEYEVPIVENPPLARAIYASVEIGHKIPEQFYGAVATIIRYINDLKS